MKNKNLRKNALSKSSPCVPIKHLPCKNRIVSKKSSIALIISTKVPMVLKISKFVMKSSVFSSITITIIVGRNILVICNE